MKCWVGDCNHHKTRDNCSFFTIPNTPLQRRRKSWKISIGNGRSPPVCARICSCHFKDGKKGEGPTIFKRHQKAEYKHLWVSPKRRQKQVKRSLVYEISEVVQPDPIPPIGVEITSLAAGEAMPPLLTDTVGTPDVSGCFNLSPGSPAETVQYPPVAEKDVECITTPATESSSEVARLENRVKEALLVISQLKDKIGVAENMNLELRTKLEAEQRESAVEGARCKARAEEARLLISQLHQRICIAEELNVQLKTKLGEEQCRLLYKCLSGSDSKICQYTGLPSRNAFRWLLDCFPTPLNYYHGNKSVVSLSKEDQLLLTLMKLRHAFTHRVLGDWFKVSETTVTNVFRTWVSAMHTLLFKTLMKSVPSRHKNKKSLPECFAPYPNCRIVLDCTEVRVEIPDSMRHKNLVHSGYKGYSTAKGLVGVAPNGTVTFVSDLYPGSNSDKTIVSRCGILDILEAGDLILADKGFLIQEMLPPGVSLNIPPFKRTAQFTTAQVRATTCIARARIHVERANARIKEYKILQCIPVSMFSYCTEIFQTCCALTNVKGPLIMEVEDEMRQWK